MSVCNLAISRLNRLTYGAKGLWGEGTLQHGSREVRQRSGVFMWWINCWNTFCKMSLTMRYNFLLNRSQSVSSTRLAYLYSVSDLVFQLQEQSSFIQDVLSQTRDNSSICREKVSVLYKPKQSSIVSGRPGPRSVGNLPIGR